MTAAVAQPLTIALDAGQHVSGLLCRPNDVRACYVLAHGAGAGMAHPFMAAIADGLAQGNIATLRFQFSYMERRSKRPDPPRLAQAAIRSAVAEAARFTPGLPLIAGGKSFGGRMTSQAQAAAPLPGVRGIAFLGFPLHAAGQPSHERGEHLFQVQVPLLFLQGSRDKLAELDQLQQLIERLGTRAELKLFADADHSFHVPAKTGRSNADLREEMLDALAAWIAAVTG
jgi:predicted alpha/beta-hydrolase family hydrolase